jgi:hypothetical protein
LSSVILKNKNTTYRMTKRKSLIRRRLYRVPFLLATVLLVGITLLPILAPGRAIASQISLRSLTISSGVPSATNVTYSFTFTLPGGHTSPNDRVQGIKFIACTTAVGTYPGVTCTPPAGMTGALITGDGFWNAAFSSQTAWQGASNFAVDPTGANDCLTAANVLCVNRTDTTAQTATSRTIVFNTIKNPSTANTAFYVGIDTYNDPAWTGPPVDSGTTASAVVQTLTANAAVAEVLQFCVGSTTVDDTATMVAADCSGVSGTSLNIGTLDTSAINISPVGVNGGDSKNGVAMIRTNALNGTSISYDAIQQSGTNHQGTLRISGQTCNAITNTLTDPCINAAGAQTTFTAGVEKFGMTVAGVNYGSTTSYTCTYGDTSAVPSVAVGNSCALHPSAGYLGAGTSGSSEDYNTTNGFAWVESGAATQIATSTSAIDDEALILKFAATPSITTPFGSYTAQSDYIAVPTF